MCHFFQRKKKQQSFQRLQISHYQLELESYKLEFTKVSALVSRESSITYLKNKGQKVSGLKDVQHKSLEQEYPHNHSPPPPKAEIRTGMKGGENKYIQVSLDSEACPLTDDKTDKARADGQVRWLPRQQLCTRPVPQEIPGSGGGGVRERDPSSSGHRGHPSAGLPGLAPRGTRGAPAGLKGVLTPPLGLLTLPPVRSDLARLPKDAGQTPATAAPRGRPARDAGTWGVDGAGRCVASP